MIPFYFSKLVEIFPFFLKGLWMTVQIAFISLVSCTLLGFILGIFRAGKNKLLKTNYRRLCRLCPGNAFCGSGVYHLFYSAGVGTAA